VKKLDCFSACNYQIGDRAYYELQPEDHVINLGSSVRCDKPAVLHTLLHQKGLLCGISPDGPDQKNEQRHSAELATAVSACSGTVASGSVKDTSKVIFFVRFIFAFVVFLTCLIVVNIWLIYFGNVLLYCLYDNPSFMSMCNCQCNVHNTISRVP